MAYTSLITANVCRFPRRIVMLRTAVCALKNSPYLCGMSEWMDLIEETKAHFQEGARSVRAYSENMTYIITKGHDQAEFVVTREAPGFPKQRTRTLDAYFHEVFGIEARY